MKMPSVKTLMTLRLTKEQAVSIRYCAAKEGGNAALELADDFLRGHGIEYIPQGHNRKSPAIEYVNMGDPYEWTLMLIKGRLQVGCWGDIVARGSYD